MLRHIVCVIVAVLIGWPLEGLAEEFKNPKANIPPKAAPHHRNAGEGFPPLPLPATPLRRSEKKREPAPPALVGNLTFSDTALKKAGANWETTVIDIEQWVSFTNNQLGQRYRFVNTDFSKFSYDPTELPILYFTGWKPLPQLDEKTLERLRTYLSDGGTLVVHSNCGRPEFNESARRELGRLFPNRELMALPSDHPIYSAFHKIRSMRVRKGKEAWQTVPPYLESINLGTRAAVVFSPIDLSCGWDANANPIEGGVLYDQEDAKKLGANIVTYCLAEYQYGRFFANQKIYHQARDKSRDELVLGQIKHNGDYDPTPHGVPNLLKQMDQGTTLKVQFKRVEVELDKDDIFAFPVLYMTGQRKFELSDAACKRLRQYLDNGGILVADCAEPGAGDVMRGEGEFNKSFRQHIAKIYPERKLKLIDQDHPMLKFVYDTRVTNMAPLAQQLYGKTMVPALEVIEVDGQVPVIYSPLGLSTGWEQLPRAYNRGYADADALKLGINIFMYAVSH